MNRLYLRILPAFLLVLATLQIVGCTGSAIGVGALSGLAAYEERSIKVIARDTKIALQLRAALLNKSQKHFIQIGIEVFEGRVLMTGGVASAQIRADAIGIAWKVANVKAVLNEMHIGLSTITDTARDAFITAQLTSKITLDKEIMAINYSLETVAGTIYLIGIAQNTVELEKVIAHARTLNYVRKIISHVRIKDLK